MKTILESIRDNSQSLTEDIKRELMNISEGFFANVGVKEEYVKDWIEKNLTDGYHPQRMKRFSFNATNNTIVLNDEWIVKINNKNFTGWIPGVRFVDKDGDDIKYFFIPPTDNGLIMI